VVVDVQTLLSRTIGEHVELVVDLGPDVTVVRADRGQLEQVLVNLAVNARDAMPGGGTLTIETGTVEFNDDDTWARRGLRTGRYLTLSVSDTGVGMTPEVIAHAFEPFFTTKPRGEGTGLGLATVYGIVTEAGGSAILYSKRELGTTVRVYLPAADEPATTSSLPAPRVRPGAGETILVVEDEQAMREVAVRILRRNGYRALEAAAGDEALSILRAYSCDMLLTDVIMPQMSGRELVERVHERQPGLRVLYMSGYSRGVLGPERALDGTIALIQKPFSEQALVEKVRAVLTADAPNAADPS
jgi:CheY-like chemotaxis protein